MRYGMKGDGQSAIVHIHLYGRAAASALNGKDKLVGSTAYKKKMKTSCC